MQALDPAAHFGLFLNRNFLDAESCANLLIEVDSSPTTQAPVYIEGTEGTIHENIRKTTSLHPSDETISRMWNLLFQQKPLLESHFGESLTDCERPQFLRYEKGDFFVRHQDGNTKQLDFDHLRVRRISIVVFLNDSFSGGALRFHDGATTFDLQGKAGLLVAFRAEVFHEVAPVMSGERFTMITWFR
jgi:predicted 2-oxoglutarate/Fe(II)-dependent dioxygenase YbiX